MQWMRTDTADPYELKELQNKILEVMLWIDSVCDKHNIRYCLMGGSAIGAKRHGGFIPWDDDLDIFMDQESYSRFRDLFTDNRLEGFYLQEWGERDGMVTMAKVRMDGTAYIEPLLESLNIHHGIYVDIMVLHNCPKSRIKQRIQYYCARYVVAKGLADRGYNRRKDLAGKLLKLLGLLPRGFGIRAALKQVYRYDKKPTGFYCNFLGKSNFQKSIYPAEWINEPVYAPFETVQLKIPAQAEKYLRARFGDYMQIPSADRILWEQHAKAYAVDQHFTALLQREFDTYPDEKTLI